MSKLGRVWSTCNRLLAAGSAILFLFAFAQARAAVIDVNSTVDAPATNTALNQGICADVSGACTLRAAVQVADGAPGASTINVPAGTYSLTVGGVDETYATSPGSAGSGYQLVATPNPAIGDLNITQSMTIIGVGPGQTIIGWGVAQGDRIFHVEAVNNNISVSFQGLTIQNGSVADPVVLDASNPKAVVEFVRYGGGIAIGTGAAVMTVDTTVTHGQGQGGGGGEGGGGHESGGEETGFSVNAVTLSNVYLLNNYSGSDGGGIYNSEAPLTIDNSIISGNVSGAGNGGGIYSEGALAIRYALIGAMSTNSSYTGNMAENGGGIFETGFHTSTIEQSAINGNYAVSGGGMAGRRLVEDFITNTTIAGNVAEDTGGGITTNGRVNLVNDTVAGNTVSSDSEGGGAGINSFATGGGGQYNYTLVNTVIANNTVATTPPTIANCGGQGQSVTFLSNGHNLENANTCDLNATGDLPNTDPLLEALAMNGGPTETMALPQASPAVDAGDNSRCPNNDQRDSLRPADGNLDGVYICDIGAFELFIPVADLHINDMTAPNSVFVGDDFEVTVSVHIDPLATTSSTGIQFTTDQLPADLAVNSATVTTPAGASPCTVASGVVTCNAGTLAADQIAMVNLNLKAINPASKLTITANVTQASPTDPDLTNNSASVNVEAIGLSDLAVAATTVSQPLAVGTDLVLPFTVSNAGPHDAGPVRVGILLPQELAYKSVNLSGWTCTTPESDSVLCTLDSFTTGSSMSGELTVTGAVVGTASTAFGIQARQRDTNTSNNSVTLTFPVQQIADLGLIGDFSKTSVYEGSRVSLNLTAANAGPSDATGVTIVTQLPTGLSFESAANGAACAGMSTVTCTVGNLAAGQSIKITLNLKTSSKAGASTTSSTIQGDGTDPDLSNNTEQSVIHVNSNSGGGASTPLGLILLGLLLGFAAASRRLLDRRHPI